MLPRFLISSCFGRRPPHLTEPYVTATIVYKITEEEILVEEMTFVDPSHVAPGARTDLLIKLLTNGTFYPTKQKALLTF